MRTSFVCLLVMFCLQVYAQRECATTAYVNEQVSLQPSLRSTIEEIESSQRNQQLASSRTISESIIRIPVVVHILYSNASQNISDAQVKSGIEALNRDFRKWNADTVNTPLEFRHLAADIGIEFVLATADPLGRPTNGIVRKSTTISQWTFDDKIKFSAQGGSNAWDSKSYLNIWIGYMPNLLGYSSVPGSEPGRDGVVITPAAFGTIGVSGAYALGRTAVHEVGHWLGLKHIWGDTYCGDDGVEDTPSQSTYTIGCPTGIRTSCGNNGNMYMNYMDFADDACMNLFTTGQKLRMRSLFNAPGARNSLLSSKGLNEPWMEGSPLPEEPATTGELLVYPVPSLSKITIDPNNNIQFSGRQFRIVNAQGVVLYKGLINGNRQTIDISHFATGIYFLQVQAENGIISKKILKL